MTLGSNRSPLIPVAQVADPHQRPPQAAVVTIAVSVARTAVAAAGRFLPENECAAGGVCLQAVGLAILDVGPVVFFIEHVESHGRDAADAGTSDHSRTKRFLQDQEPAQVVVFRRRDADDRNLILKTEQTLAGSEDRSVDSEHMKPLQVISGAVLDQDDPGLREIELSLAGDVLGPVPKVLRGIDKRVERPGRNTKPITALHLFEGVAHVETNKCYSACAYTALMQPGKVTWPRLGFT